MTLIQHYGIVVLGDVEPEAKDIERLRYYIDGCARLKRPEVGLIYQIGLVARTDRDWQGKVRDRLLDASHLPEGRRDFFFQAFIAQADPRTIAREPEARHLRVAEVFARVLDAFPEVFAPSHGEAPPPPEPRH